MDEIDFLKKVFKTITISFSVITIFILFVVIRETVNKEVVLYAVMICGGVYAIDIIMYYILKTVFIGRKSFNYLKNNDIYRNILTNYPPAIYSFLYNKKIESYTDYTATILNLECKKYLKISDDDSDIVVLNNDLEGLYEHEKYVMNCIMKNVQFDMAEFNKKIIIDLKQADLIELLENKTHRNIIGNEHIQILLIVLSVLLILYLLVINLQIMSTILLCGLFILLLVSGLRDIISISLLVKTDGEEIKYKFTKKGKKVRKYVYGLKKFLREYTLINEREIKYKELFKIYIAYALSLGEAKVVEEFVSNNQKYRSIIYKSK